MTRRRRTSKEAAVGEPVRNRRKGASPTSLIVAGLAVVVLAVGAAAVFLLNRQVEVPPNEAATVTTLRAVARAQAQFNSRRNGYAVSAAMLMEPDKMLAVSTAQAFVDNGGNGDPATPTPERGYIFQMIQGSVPGARRNFLKDSSDPTKGMGDWACIARPLNPGPEGRAQYMVVEMGMVLYHSGEGATGFLLDYRPPNDTLAKMGWVPVGY